MTISHGTDIENVQTGSGKDTLIGNHLSNTLISGSGDDKIFGEGIDVINSGGGDDIIDLSEINPTSNILVFDQDDHILGTDKIYGSCRERWNILNIMAFTEAITGLATLVDLNNVPIGRIDNCILPVFGSGLDDAKSVSQMQKRVNDYRI